MSLAFGIIVSLLLAIRSAQRSATRRISSYVRGRRRGRCSNYPVGLRFEHLRRFVAAVMIDFGAVGDCMVVASRPAVALGETCNWNVAYLKQRENDIDIFV